MFIKYISVDSEIRIKKNFKQTSFYNKIINKVVTHIRFIQNNNVQDSIPKTGFSLAFVKKVATPTL